MRKLIATIMVFVLAFSIEFGGGWQKAEAASKYITVKDYANALAKELGLSPVDEDEVNGYVNQLISVGIIREGDFIDYKDYLKRGDMLVLMSRADEYLNGTQVDADLVQLVIDKRIYDIKNIATSKREEVARGYIKGFLKGFSKGYYKPYRNLKLANLIVKTDAIKCLKMIIDTSLRAKVSPDGQLIRTTNLPKNASSYEYILECYPNSFYEKQFEFMLYDKWKDNNYKPYYAFPVDMRHRMFKNNYEEWPLSEEMDKYLYDWQAKVEEYLNYIFNVDYRTVNDKWIYGVASVFANSNIDYADYIKTYYIGPMKKNHVVIKSSIIAVEPSTFYKDDNYCMRAYVKYRISANDMTVDQMGILFAQNPLLYNLKSGQWREGVFDIKFSTNNGSSGDGSDLAINWMTNFVDGYNIPVQ